MATLKYISLLLMFVFVQSREFDVEEIHKTLNASFNECRDENPGFVVCVVKDGQLIFSRGYGVVNFNDSNNPVTEDTVFGLASISKSFAATLLVKLLYENTSLTVDSKVRELLGSKFKMPDEFRTQETTFADLMAHRTAVPPNNKIRYDGNLTRATLLERIHLLDPSPHQFRVKYMYSNLMYGLVTRLAEILGHQSWEDLVRTHLFEPLGMNSSTFATQVDFSRPDVAAGAEKNAVTKEFDRVSPSFSRKWAELSGSGSVMSSARDMGKWLNFHLSKGQNAAGQQVMQMKHLSEVHKPRFYISTVSSKETRKPQFPVTSNENLYAHGFRQGLYRGFRRLTHTGSTWGYRAMMSLLPDQNIGVFTAITGRDDSFMFRVPVHMFLLDEALGFKPWLNATTICSYPHPWKKRKGPSRRARLNPDVTLKRDISEYQGTYHHPAFGYLHIVHNDSLPGLIMTYGWGRWQLFTQYSKRNAKDAFYAKGLSINRFDNIKPVEFQADPNNSSAIIQVKVVGFEPKAPPVFLKNGPRSEGKQNSTKSEDKHNTRSEDKPSCNENSDNTAAKLSWMSFIVILLPVIFLQNVV